jgi:hypothetical protein
MTLLEIIETHKYSSANRNFNPPGCFKKSEFTFEKPTMQCQVYVDLSVITGCRSVCVMEILLLMHENGKMRLVETIQGMRHRSHFILFYCYLILLQVESHGTIRCFIGEIKHSSKQTMFLFRGKFAQCLTFYF